MTALRLRRTARRKHPRYYGNTTVAFGLNNQPMNSAVRRYAMRERCDHSGTLTSISTYCITGSGYSLGTGGSVECRVETGDANGLPSGTLVSAGANVTISTPNSSAIRTWNFTTPPVLDSGQAYYFVFGNKDASPAANFISIDGVYLVDYGTIGSPIPQPTVPDDYRMAFYDDTGSGWILANWYFHPILRLLYADGAKRGQPYYEVATKNNIGGNEKVRLRFTPPSTIVVKAAHMLVAKANGSTSATLVATLKDLTGPTTLDSTSWPASAVHAITTGELGARYVDWTFSSPITLTSGTSYALELSSAEATNKYNAAASRYGGVAGFSTLLDTDGRFTEGIAELSTDGTTFSDGGVLTNQSQYQFYFEVA